VLDTGNVLNSEVYQYHDMNYSLVMDSLNLMEYRAINLGNWDLYSSSSFVEKACSNNNTIPLISANVTSLKAQESCIQKYIIREINGIKIGITGIIPQQSSFRPPDKRFPIIDPAAALNDIIPDLDKNSDFIVLLSQLPAIATQEMVKNFPDIDLALCADSIPTDLESLSTHRVMTIVGQGKQIGVVSIEKDQQNTTIKESRTILLGNNIDSDPAIQNLISDYYKKIELQREKKKEIEIAKEEKKLLQLTPEEFIKQYNNERKKK